jgi:hypothetical protein
MRFAARHCKKSCVTFFCEQNRNTLFPSFYIISSKFAVSLFTAREIRILENGSVLGVGEKREWHTRKAGRDHLAARSVSFLSERAAR